MNSSSLSPLFEASPKNSSPLDARHHGVTSYGHPHSDSSNIVSSVVTNISKINEVPTVEEEPPGPSLIFFDSKESFQDSIAAADYEEEYEEVLTEEVLTEEVENTTTVAFPSSSSSSSEIIQTVKKDPSYKKLDQGRISIEQSDVGLEKANISGGASETSTSQRFSQLPIGIRQRRRHIGTNGKNRVYPSIESAVSPNYIPSNSKEQQQHDSISPSNDLAGSTHPSSPVYSESTAIIPCHQARPRSPVITPVLNHKWNPPPFLNSTAREPGKEEIRPSRSIYRPSSSVRLSHYDSETLGQPETSLGYTRNHDVSCTRESELPTNRSSPDDFSSHHHQQQSYLGRRNCSNSMTSHALLTMERVLFQPFRLFLWVTELLKSFSFTTANFLRFLLLWFFPALTIWMFCVSLCGLFFLWCYVLIYYIAIPDRIRSFPVYFDYHPHSDSLSNPFVPLLFPSTTPSPIPFSPSSHYPTTTSECKSSSSINNFENGVSSSVQKSMLCSYPTSSITSCPQTSTTLFSWFRRSSPICPIISVPSINRNSLNHQQLTETSKLEDIHNTFPAKEIITDTVTTTSTIKQGKRHLFADASIIEQKNLLLNNEIHGNQKMHRQNLPNKEKKKKIYHRKEKEYESRKRQNNYEDDVDDDDDYDDDDHDDNYREYYSNGANIERKSNHNGRYRRDKLIDNKNKRKKRRKETRNNIEFNNDMEKNAAVAFITFDNRTWESSPHGISFHEYCLRLHHKKKTDQHTRTTAETIHPSTSTTTGIFEKADLRLPNALVLGYNTDVALEFHHAPYVKTPPLQQPSSQLVPPNRFGSGNTFILTGGGYNGYGMGVDYSQFKPQPYDRQKDPYQQHSYHRDYNPSQNDYHGASSSEVSPMMMSHLVQPQFSSTSSFIVMFTLELFNSECTRVARSTRPHVITPRGAFRDSLQSIINYLPALFNLYESTVQARINLIEGISYTQETDLKLGRLIMLPAIPIYNAQLIFEIRLIGIRRIMREYFWLSLIGFVSFGTLVTSPLLACCCFAAYARAMRSFSTVACSSPALQKRCYSDRDKQRNNNRSLSYRHSQRRGRSVSINPRIEASNNDNELFNNQM